MAEPLILRPYQQHDVAALRAQYAAGRRAVIYQLATGGGKTRCLTQTRVVRRMARNTSCVVRVTLGDGTGLVHRHRYPHPGRQVPGQMGLPLAAAGAQ